MNSSGRHDLLCVWRGACSGEVGERNSRMTKSVATNAVGMLGEAVEKLI